MSLWTWYESIPASIREPVRSAVVSSALGLWTALTTSAGIALSDGSLSTPTSTFSWVQEHYWGILIGFVVGASASATHRAQQAQARVANTVTLAGGTTLADGSPITEGSTVVVTPPPNAPAPAPKKGP